MDITVKNAILKISKAEAVRKETELLMKPYANWEEYLMPGPLSIAILGELVFISSNTDFSINKNPPKGGFKYIKYPDSFRACLMQVSNSGWIAFNKAHKNMDQIRLHSNNVPSYMKMTVKTLLQDNNQIVQALLPGQLENIRTIADECTRLAESTENKFTDVILLIQEMLEACLNSKQCYEEDVKEVQLKLEEAKLKKESAEKAKAMAEKNFGKMDKQLDEVHKQFTSAMESMPNGWEMIGMSFVEGLTNTVNESVSGFLAVSSGPSKIVSLVKNSIGEKSAESNPFAANNVYSKSGQLLKLAEQINSFVDKDKIKWSEVYDQKTSPAKSSWLKQQLQNIESSLKSEENCQAKDKSVVVCKDAMSICDLLTEFAPKNNCKPEEEKDLITKIQNLKAQTEQLDSESKAFTNSSSFSATPPQMARNTQSGGKKSAAQMATDNAHFRIEQSRAQLEKVQEMYQKSMENLEKNNKELSDILVTMRSCEIKEIDFNTTVKMLVKGLDAMGRVKEQWEKMVLFFQMISNLINTCLNTSLKRFISTADNIQGIQGYSSNAFIKDMIYTQAFNASNIANLVYMISGTYTEVSSKYLMDRVSSLGKLMALDPKNPTFERERAKLANDCDSAQNEIYKLVLKRKEEFERGSKKRVDMIDQELLAVLPPASDEEIKKIKDNVQTGMKEITAAEEDQFG
ncbi:uncharacterized protein LOC117401739 [Acipenser ruthenus]|uniref:uncharacterized protein LOC117401739 n=1 Tax=Acipenser ruthenus TaxID=7906 RepID=UPI0027410DFB|nr:uncharacterized protein LOC117401739 [Acipenser ruthenus]